MFKANSDNSSVSAVPAAAGDTREPEDFEELFLGSAAKGLSQRHKKIRSGITQVGREMASIINELEKLKGDFNEISGRFASESENAARKCRKADLRKQTPVKDNLGDAKEIKRLNSIIRKQGFKIAEFVKGMNIAVSTFYQKVEKHLFTMQELNYLRKVLDLSDDDFMKIFFT